MRNLIILILAAAVPSSVYGQFGISFHQSNLPFVGFSYEINNKLRPELRVGIDNLFEQTSIEGILTYDLANKEDYELYAGLGLRVNGFAGLIIPLGLNIYPLPTKQFGFHIEIAPIIGELSLLRGSWGIRYRFRKSD